MQVSKDVRECVVFIGYLKKTDEQFTLAGTGFFVTLEEGGLQFHYLITARHVVAQISRHGLDHRVIIRINTKSGSFEYVNSRHDQWLFPEDSSVDVAVLLWLPGSKYEFRVCPSSMFLTEAVIRKQRIGAGDDIFTVGLFASHYGRQRNVPIIRIGNISCMPEERIDTAMFGPMEGYIIEARSIGGLSGSPVFVTLGMQRIIEGDDGNASAVISSGNPFYLLGLVHGHWDVQPEANDIIDTDNISAHEGRVNMGMAIVTPAHKILEVLLEGDCARLRAEQLAIRDKNLAQPKPVD